MSSLHGEPAAARSLTKYGCGSPAARRDRKAAQAIGFEMRALHMHGPGGAGGGCEPRVREVLAVKSVLLPRELVNPQVVVEGAL